MWFRALELRVSEFRVEGFGFSQGGLGWPLMFEASVSGDLVRENSTCLGYILNTMLVPTCGAHFQSFVPVFPEWGAPILIPIYFSPDYKKP